MRASFLGKNFAGSDSQTARIPAAPYAGRIGVFEIALHGAGEANSEVLVSNLRLLRVPLPKLTAKLKADATFELTLNGERG